MNQPDDQKQPGDFAKIVRGTSGQQVLFYLEDSADDANTLHCVANYDGIQADMKLGGLPDEAFKAALDKADVAMADKVLAQLAELGLSNETAQGV
jgi:hypothetical protein